MDSKTLFVKIIDKHKKILWKIAEPSFNRALLALEEDKKMNCRIKHEIAHSLYNILLCGAFNREITEDDIADKLFNVSFDNKEKMEYCRRHNIKIH